MVKQHLKRFASPRTWPIMKKTLTYITRPNPGPHKIEMQLPITVVLRDLIGVVSSTKEVKFVLHNKDCLIDGSVCHDNKRPVGFMDVISFPKRDESYRMSITTKNKLVANLIPKSESDKKLCKITKKVSLKKGITQVCTSDARSFRVTDASSYKVGDSLLVSIPDQKIIDHLPFAKNNTIVLSGGSHVGVVAVVEGFENDLVLVKTKNGIYKTKKTYAFVIGKDKPLITV